VTSYGLNDQGLISAGAEDLSSSFCVQTSYGAHPASYTRVQGFLSPAIKRGRNVTLATSPASIVPMSRMSRSYTSSHRECLQSV
jgi:hypothetical protein